MDEIYEEIAMKYSVSVEEVKYEIQLVIECI